MLDECERAVARGDHKPAEGMLRRVLIWAVYRSNISLVAEAVRLGATASAAIDDNNFSSSERLLIWAAPQEKEELVRRLLVAGAGEDGLPGILMALEVACHLGRESAVKALLTAGPDSSPSPAVKDGESHKR